MNHSQTIEALGALAHDTRLTVFRLLVQSGAAGMAAGDIADALDVRQNTMSTNLSILARAGLVTSHRDGRSIIYRANFDTMRDLLGYLMEDCCGGQPDLCRQVLDEVMCGC